MDRTKFCLGLFCLLIVAGCSRVPEAAQPLQPDSGDAAARETPTTSGSDRTLLMAHYMPWYQSPEKSGYWGWHWTMDHFDPKQVDANGSIQIASHYMPLTGPYDSKDADLLDYQVLLMKLSGIDGVIVDWYGVSTYADYSVNHQAAERLFEHIKEAGLLFAVCYEDQTIKHRIEANQLSDANAYPAGQEDMQVLQDTWFKEDAYLKFEGRPVLFNFGPQYFVNAGDWETLFTGLDPQPILVTLDRHWSSASTATYPWPPMSSSQEGVLSFAAVEAYLDGFYQKSESYNYVVGGAFPGFHDIYQEAGVGSSYGFLDAQDGLTFQMTLDKAIAQNPDVIQLITWNDYGEGTIIEPTEQFGFRYLEMLQGAQAALGNPGFAYSAADLRLPLKLFQMRKSQPDPEMWAKLEEAFSLLLAGDTARAAELLEE